MRGGGRCRRREALGQWRTNGVAGCGMRRGRIRSTGTGSDAVAAEVVGAGLPWTTAAKAQGGKARAGPVVRGGATTCAGASPVRPGIKKQGYRTCVGAYWSSCWLHKPGGRCALNAISVKIAGLVRCARGRAGGTENDGAEEGLPVWPFAMLCRHVGPLVFVHPPAMDNARKPSHHVAHFPAH